MKKIILLLVLYVSASSVFAQASIYGKVYEEENGEGVIGASLVLSKSGVFANGAATDFDGYYSFPLDPGKYTLKVSYVGFPETIINDILIIGGQSTEVNIELVFGGSNSTDVAETSQQAIADSTLYSSLKGKVTDEETGEVLIGASVVLSKNGVFVNGAATDFDGNYELMVKPGKYDLKVSYTGYPEKNITEITLFAEQNLSLNISLEYDPNSITICGTPDWKIPLIEMENTTSGNTITSDQIRNQSIKEIKELIINTPGISINNY